MKPSKNRKISVVIDLVKDKAAREEYLKLQEDPVQRLEERLKERRKLEYEAERKWGNFSIKW